MQNPAVSNQIPGCRVEPKDFGQNETPTRGCQHCGVKEATMVQRDCGAEILSPPVLKAPTTKVRIYRPAPNAMQAGRANSKQWVLEFEPRSRPLVEPLMGWTGTRDTLQQVRLKFPTKKSAAAFAERQGWAYSVIQPHDPRLRRKNYADNFRFVEPSHPADPKSVRLRRSETELAEKET